MMMRLTGLAAVELERTLVLAVLAVMGGLAVMRGPAARAGRPQPHPARRPGSADAAAWQKLHHMTADATAVWHAALHQLHQRYYVIAALLIGLGTVLLLAH
jgi:hypothetical protein